MLTLNNLILANLGTLLLGLYVNNPGFIAMSTGGLITILLILVLGVKS